MASWPVLLGNGTSHQTRLRRLRRHTTSQWDDVVIGFEANYTPSERQFGRDYAHCR